MASWLNWNRARNRKRGVPDYFSRYDNGLGVRVIVEDDYRHPPTLRRNVTIVFLLLFARIHFRFELVCEED